MGTKTVLVGVRMPADLIKKIDKLVKETERSRTFVLTKAAELYLKENEDCEIALSRLQDPTDPVIPWEEMGNRVSR